ncbi:MAG: coniferyl aldehyde dehydrogenase [Desulfosarcinaceae bacterium]|nr:coniferyl aldehyde dehydrogenase [Desulfosarcinaceae bacterium]
MTSDRANTSLESLQHLFNCQQKAFKNDRLPSAKRRKRHLRRLSSAIQKYRTRLIDAVNTDFNGRSQDETLLAEIYPSLQGIRYAIRHLDRWMRPSARRVGMILQPARARVIYQPLGVVGVISPWNYPVYLTLGPLTGSLSAGNRTMIKASEFTLNTAWALKEMLAEIFSADHVTVVIGESDVAVAFSELPFDHLLFTGSTSVGRSVMRAAAKNLTPVTLELGGKSPALIGPDYPIKIAAERIAFGKCLNAGQTCIAPDYVLCPQHHLNAFVNHFSSAVSRMYPTMATNPDYSAIVNSRQFNRICGYLDDARSQGAQLLEINPAEENFSGCLKMPVWLVLNPSETMMVMQEEIFGPILPIITYQKISEAINYINNHPYPLALYYFEEDRKKIKHLINHTRSGGVCINDTLRHVVVDDMPFGGIGQSGMGEYHGKEGFLTFSKARSIFETGRINTSFLAWPPYGRSIHRWLYKFLFR